jgi:hypothetical protein
MTNEMALMIRATGLLDALCERPAEANHMMEIIKSLKEEIDIYIGMMAKTINVGDIVRFGTENGEKTRAKVLKINVKTFRVELLEKRGKNGRYPIGDIWNARKEGCVKIGNK